jgi:Zn-dependent protease with chaperone function
MTKAQPPQPARPRYTVLTQISSQAWEHPTDRAALNALRLVPGFDEVVRKVCGFFGERGVRLLFQANAVHVGPSQFPRVYQACTDVCTTLDWEPRPEVYVSQTPFVNAGAFGMEHPFIVLNSATLGLLDEAELHMIVGHELGHIISGHALYRTLCLLLLTLGLRHMPFLAGVAVLPVQLALLEWYRKSELSCDRAGLLATQDPLAAMRMFMKLAGGGPGEEMDLNAFLVQARAYVEGGDVVELIAKVLNTLGMTHPFHTLRAAELQRWVEGGDYDRILRGEYPHRRAQEATRPLADDFKDASQYYAEQAREAMHTVSEAAHKARHALLNTFKG